MSDYQREVYNEKASEKGKERRLRKIRKILYDLVKNGEKKILDVGCGDGKLLAPFCKNNRCYGVDIARTPLKTASELGIATFEMNLERESLPFKDEFFDIVICGEVIEHLVNTDHLLSEINRVMPLHEDREAHFVLSFPNVSQPLSWLMLLLDYPPKYSARYKSPHVKDFTLRTIRAALENNGFKIGKVEGTSRLARKIPRLSDQIIVVALKVDRPKPTPRVAWDVRKLAHNERAKGYEGK